MFSSENTKHEVINITYEHPYYEDNFDVKFQAELSPYSQSFEQSEEKLIEFKGKHQMEPNKFSSEHIKMKCLTSLLNIHLPKITLRKFHAKIYPSNIIIEQKEEELIYFKGKQQM